MKARTKLQLRVTRLSNHLPRITTKQEQWAFKECLPHLGFANKSSVFCLDCGNTFSPELVKRKRATCPHCQTKLHIQITRKTTFEFKNYFAIAHVVEDFQVCENFELIAYYKKGRPVKHFLHPILEDWMLPNGKVTKIGLSHRNNWFCDAWIGDWEIRQETGSYYSRGKYDVYARMYHPDSEFKPEYLKIGINHHLSGLSLIEAIKTVPNSSIAETLLKAKQYSLLARYHDYSGQVSQCWPSIKICIRNKYIVQNASDWIDYLDLLRYFRKDLRNAKYVCPKNLKAQHDRLVAKKKAIEKKLEIERRRQEIEAAEVDFAKRIKAFAGLQFGNGVIVIKVLETVKEFEKEGDLLKHCLFTNDYYSKEDSLILSARINDTPIETIEISLSKLKILQSRGYGNQPTEHNKKIISLVKKNLNKIKELKVQAFQQKEIS
jgi:hypothetical protein